MNWETATRHRRSATVIAFCVLAAQVSATYELHLQPIKDRGRRVEVPGVSVLPPQGGTWYLAPVSPQEGIPQTALIRFFKRLGDKPPAQPKDARQVAAAVAVKNRGTTRTYTPAEFLQAFTGGDPKRSIGEMMTQRQRLVDLDAAIDDSIPATCVRYRRLTEITGQFPTLPGLVAMALTNGLYCSHPKWPQYHIDVTFQQNYAKGQEPLSLDDDSNAFLASVVFTDVQPRASKGVQ